MLTEDRLFRHSDPDFPTTRVMQKIPCSPSTAPVSTFRCRTSGRGDRHRRENSRSPEGPSIRLARPARALAGRSARTRTGRAIWRRCEVCH